jgi:hypothetical protein
MDAIRSIATRHGRGRTALLLAASMAAGVLLVMRAPSSVSADVALAEHWRADLDAALAASGVRLLGEFRSAGEDPCLVLASGDGDGDAAGVAMLRRMPAPPPARDWWVLYRPGEDVAGLDEAFPPGSPWHLDPSRRAAWRAHPSVQAVPLASADALPVSEAIARWQGSCPSSGQARLRSPWQASDLP